MVRARFGKRVTQIMIILISILMLSGMTNFVGVVIGSETSDNDAINLSSEQSKVYSLGCIPDSPEVFEGAPRISYNLTEVEVKSLPISVDLTADLPPVGDQGDQGSCVGWATGYYYKTFQEKKEHGWDVTTTNHQFSPAFIYNQINDGKDEGSNRWTALGLICDKGCAPLNLTPYDDTDYYTWPTENAFDYALQFRADSRSYITFTSSDISDLKAHLGDGDCFVMGIPIYRPDETTAGAFDNLDTADYFYEGPEAGEINIGGHAIVIAGYDDNAGGGVGGFKLRNSWGTDWGYYGDAYISYDFVKDYCYYHSSIVVVMSDKTGYVPTAKAVIEIDHSYRGQLKVTLNIGEVGSPIWTTTVYDHAGGGYANIYTVSDLTDGESYLSSSNEVFLDVYDDVAGGAGQIKMFKVTTDEGEWVNDNDIDIPDNTGGHGISCVSCVFTNTIYINGNSQFTSANGVASGSGTELDPYIIENRNIDASNVDGVHIKNTDAFFIIRNCVIHGDGTWRGIQFADVTNGKIEDVTSYNNSYGIHLGDSSNNQITNCIVYNNSNHGVCLYCYSSNNNITNCTIHNNSGDGIRLELYSNNNQITTCEVYNNSYGIRLCYSSNNNQITYCNITDNTNCGIWIDPDVDWLSNYNIFHHNNFINNVHNAYDSWQCTNYWDNGVNEGNYWDDYTGVDDNGDGVGDIAYDISGGSKDNYPLMFPVGANRPPIIQSYNPAFDPIINETESITFNITVYDFEDNIVTIQWYLNDAVVDTGDLYTFVSDYESAGIYTVNVTVSDGEHNVSHEWTLTVNNVNRAPVIDSYSPETEPTITEEETQIFTVTASDPDDDPLTTEWYLNDTLVDTDTSYMFIGNYTSAGSYEVKVIVSDGSLFVNRIWTLNVTNVNRPPVLSNSLPDSSFDEDTVSSNAFNLNDYFSDPDGENLDYTASGNNHIFVVINDNGTVDLQASINWHGSETITFRATDPYDAFVEDIIIVTVNPVNDAPVIVGILPIFDKDEDDPVWVLDLTNNKSDVDNPLSELVWSVSNWNTSLFNSITVLDNNITFDLKSNAYGNNKVTITLSDGLLTDSQSIWINVTPINDPPVIAGLTDQPLREDVTFWYDITLYISDIDNDISDLVVTANSSYIIVHNNNHTLEMNYPNGITVDYVRITVSDGVLLDYDDVIFTITPVNDAPVISGVPTQYATEDTDLYLDVSPYISDVDNSTDELTISTNSSYATVNGFIITFNYPNGVLSENVRTTVSDGINTSYQDIMVIVTAVNDAPAATFIYVPEDPTTADIIQFTENSIDSDGTIVSWFWEFGDGSTSTEQKPEHQYADDGTYYVNLTVTDNGGVSNTTTNRVIVTHYTPIEQPPTNVTLTITEITENSVLLSWSQNMDADFANYTIYISKEPTLLGNVHKVIADRETNEFNTTNLSPSTVYYITIRVYDTEGLSNDTKTIAATHSVEVTETIEPTGGNITIEKLTLVIPPNAVSENISFNITTISVTPPEGYEIVGNVYNIECAVTTFTNPITITLSFKGIILPNGVSEDDLAIYKRTDNTWDRLGGTIDKTNKTISVEITTLSGFAIFYKTPVEEDEADEEPTGEEEGGRKLIIGDTTCFVLVIAVAVIIVSAIVFAIGGRKERLPPVAPTPPPSQPPPSKPIPQPVEQPPTKITIQCPGCGHTGKVDPSFHGKLRCPACHNVFEV